MEHRGGPLNVAPPEPVGPAPADESTTQLLRRALSQSPLAQRASRLASPVVLEVVLAFLVAAASFLAAVPALHAYRVPGAPAMLLASAVLATLVAHVAARVLRLSPLVSYLASIAGLIVLLAVGDGPHPQAVATALARGPNRVLTETLPLSGGRAAITPLVVLVWVCAAATSEILIRTPRRRGAGLAALILPLGLYVACYAIASSAPTRDRVAGPVLLVVLATASAVRIELTTPAEVDPDPEVRPPSRLRAPLIGLATAGLAAVVLAALTPAVGILRTEPTNLRRSLPTITPVITDPLDTMGQLRDRDPHAAPLKELSVTLSNSSTGYLGMAYLDDYDGGEWRFTATFQPTGGRIPSALPTPALLAGHSVSQHVAVDGRLPIPLLPALDRPVEVSQVQADTDPATGMLVASGGASHPSYTVVSAAPAGALGDVPEADGIDYTMGVSDLAIPPDTAGDLATTVRFVSALTGGVHPDQSLAFLQAAAQALQTKEKRVVPSAPAAAPSGRAGTAPSPPRSAKAKSNPTTTTTTPGPTSSAGTSLSEVINAVTVNRAATPEQFATFYAMVARYLGVPARVVSGFRLAPTSSGSPVAAGSYTVTNRQAWAWVEIPVAGYGWVVCDPTPDVTTAASNAPPESVSAPDTTIPPRQANLVPRNAITGAHPVAPPSHVTGPPSSTTPSWVLALISLAALIVVVALAGPGQAAIRRGWRRRCRRSTDPGLLAVGAWLELLDGLDRAGMRAGPGATATEVAGEVGHHFGSEYVDRAATVAHLADQAVFSTASPVPPEDARQAWEDARVIRRGVLAGLDTRQRMRSSLLVGSAPIRPSASRS